MIARRQTETEAKRRPRGGEGRGWNGTMDRLDFGGVHVTTATMKGVHIVVCARVRRTCMSACMRLICRRRNKKAC